MTQFHPIAATAFERLVSIITVYTGALSLPRRLLRVKHDMVSDSAAGVAVS